MSATGQKFLTPSEAARLLRVSERTLRRWSTGRNPSIPCVTIGKGERKTRRYHVESIVKAAQ